MKVTYVRSEIAPAETFRFSSAAEEHTLEADGSLVTEDPALIEELDGIPWVVRESVEDDVAEAVDVAQAQAEHEVAVRAAVEAASSASPDNQVEPDNASADLSEAEDDSAEGDNE